MKASILNLTVERPLVVEAATLGAAMIAAVGDGKFASIKQASESMHKPGKIFYPDATKVATYDEVYKRYLDLFERMYAV